MTPDPEIRIENPRVDGGELRWSVSHTDRLARFFARDEFVTEYDVDVESVPESVLAIPVLAHVCPVAWATGASVSVPTVDRRFYRSLQEIEENLCEMYPSFMTGGSLHVDEVVEEERVAPAGDSGLLFSGGVDSLATYIRHHEEDPTLVSVHGWVVAPDAEEQWAEVSEHIRTFADERDLDARFVRSNMLQFLDSTMLNAHFKRYVDGSWYSAVGHGLGLLGLCAPMAYARGLEDLYMAATHTEEFATPWGSHPKIDDNVAWTGTSAHHDAYDLSRQEKIELIADYVESRASGLAIRTCTQASDGGNCSACEKCYRTAVGLVLAGLDPNDHGYAFDQTDYARIREGFENGEWILGEDERFMWEDLQRHLPRTYDDHSAAAREFFGWLEDVDVRSLVANGSPPLRQRLLRAVGRNVPYPVYSSLYPVYSRVTGGKS